MVLTFLFWNFLLFLFQSHKIKQLDVWRQILFHVIWSKVTIYSMSITNSKKPVILYISKVLCEKESILIFFVWLIWYHPFRGLMSYFYNRILKPSINKRLNLSSWICNIDNFSIFLNFDFLCIKGFYVWTGSHFYLFTHVFHMCYMFWVKNRVRLLFSRIMKLNLCSIELSCCWVLWGFHCL